MKTQLAIKINFTVKAELTEGDLRALDALVDYGFDNFVKSFYSGLGKHYLEPHVADLKGLFETIESLRPKLYEIDQAKKKLLDLAK